MACNTRGCCALAQTGCQQTERVCIQTKRVFDACLRQFSMENITLDVTFPPHTDPLTFQSLRNTSSGDVSELSVTPVAGSSCSRVQYTVTVPVSVVATDPSGNVVTGTATMTFNQDILLRIPSEALVPVSIENVTSVIGNIGVLTGDILRCTVCVTIVTKVTAEVELIVPTNGYPKIPECQEYQQDVCAGAFQLPIYPREVR